MTRALLRLLLVAVGLIATACTDAKTVVDPTATAIEISTDVDASLAITQIRISDADDQPAFTTGSLPDEPRALAGPQTMMLLLADGLDGKDLVVRIDGLAGDAIVASGAAHVTVRAHHVSQVEIALGAPAVCGDGHVADLIEACDDGNPGGGDGCSAHCSVEPGFDCTTPPGGPTSCHVDTFDVVGAMATGNRAVAITFSDPPNPSEALVLANYTIPGLDPSGTPFLAGNTVTLATAPQAALDYNILVGGITRARDGRPLDTTVAGFTGRTAFDVMSARSTSATQIVVTFDAPPDATAATAATSYAVPGLTVTGTPVLAGNAVTLTTTNQTAIDYTVTVTGVTRASDGEPLTQTAATFTGVNGFDVASAMSTSNRQLVVAFNAPPNGALAVVLANYQVPGLALSGTPVLAGSTVTLTTAAQAATTYTVTVANVVRASDGQVLSNTSATFTGTPVVAPEVIGVAVTATAPNNGTTAYNTGTTTVQITGTQFASVVCPGGVRLDDVDGAGAAVNTVATSCTVDSDSQITATFHAGIRTNGDTGWNVVVTNTVGTSTPGGGKLVMHAGLLVSEVYVGSTNGHEFVELYNPTATALGATALGLALHVRNASGADSNRALTIANSTIPSHGFFLMASTQSNAADAWFAKKDATYVAGSGINANGGVYLSMSATANLQLLDKVGWGSQPVGGFEGSALPNIAAGASVQRLPAGGAGAATDTDNNTADFAAASTTLTPLGTADPPQP